ncbi:hypothetical protein BH10ACI2_BH10ACI2_03030 [soil metagenome]
MKNLSRSILIVLAATFFALSFLPSSSAQKKSGFSHGTPAHKKASDKNCNSCHTNPTANWVAARGFPDVADFPGHAACFACHKSDFFAGNKPAICAGCHTNPGPTGRARFPFPVRSRLHEFSTVFPHSVHQDIIASNVKKPAVAVAHFVLASFKPAPLDDKPPQFNNCSICHQPRAALPKFTARTLKDNQPLAEAITDNFLPKAEFFKDMPQGHATCFACHNQGVKPAATNCAGCHKLTTPYAESNNVPRYSLKFDHQQKDHVIKDCMTCHVRISQNADLKTLVNADVPILTCSTSSCHGSKILEEIGKRETSVAQKQAVFQCAYCHTTAIGRFPVPASHQSQ